MVGGYTFAEEGDGTALPAGLADLDPMDQRQYYDGHWHIWPAQPWYQIRIGANMSDKQGARASNLWYRRPSKASKSGINLEVNAAPIFMPEEAVYEFDPYSIDEETQRQVKNPKGDCPGLVRKLVFRWMAKPEGQVQKLKNMFEGKEGLPRDKVELIKVDGVNLPWTQTKGLAYPTSTSGTNQPPECYIYDLSKDYRNFTGPFAPDAAMLAQHEFEERTHGTPEEYATAKGKSPEYALKLFLEIGWRTPRTLAEAEQWHLDTRPDMQKSNPGCLRKRVFISPGPSAPEGVPKSQRVWRLAKKGPGARSGTFEQISVLQNLKYRYQTWATKSLPTMGMKMGMKIGSRREDSGVERDTKVLMVDISHLLATAQWKLFEDKDNGTSGILPAFEQRKGRKLQVHTLKGGLDLEKLTPKQKEAYDAFIQQLRDALASGGENVAEEVARVTNEASKGYPVDPLLGLMKVPEARDRVKSKVAARTVKGISTSDSEKERFKQEEELSAIRKFIEDGAQPPMPQTLDALIWRQESANNFYDPGTVRTVSKKGDDDLNAWYEKMSQEPTTKKRPTTIPSDIAVTPAEAATWPLLRRKPNNDSAFKGEDTGVDLFTISDGTGGGDAPQPLTSDVVNRDKIKVVTFATVQSCVPTLDWEAELNAKNITPAVLDRYNRWFYGGSDGNGGVPCFWKLSNLENPEANTQPGKIVYSLGVETLFKADNTAPFVDAGNMKAGFDGQGVSAWGRVPRDTFFKDPVMSLVHDMVTDPGLQDWPHIQPLNAEGTRRRIHNNCYIIPYALYKAEEYKEAADKDAAELERRQMRANAKAAAVERAAQVEADALLAQKAAEAAAVIAAEAAEAEAAQRQEELDAAERERLRKQAIAELQQAGWKLVQEWHKKRTVNHNGRDGADEFIGWYEGVELDRNFIRNLSDIAWWEAYKRGDDVPAPYPAPGNDTKFDGLSGSNGIRWENATAYRERLEEWKSARADEFGRLPWEPERHEAGYELYVKRASTDQPDDAKRQLQSQLRRRLKGARPEESSVNRTRYELPFGERQARWIRESKDAKKMRDKALAAKEKRLEEERKQAAEAVLATEEMEVEKDKPPEERGKKRRPSDDDPDDETPDAKLRRLLESNEAAVAADEFAGSQESGDFPGPLESAVDSVQWKVLGGMTLGRDGSADRLRLTVANLSRQGFQALWTDATLEERHAMLLLRRAGNNLMKKQAERMTHVAIE